MEPLEALELVERKLQEKGYSTKRVIEEGEYVLEVVSGVKRAKIRFHEEGGRLVELRLRYEGIPGLTILKCEKFDRYISCIEELIARL
ncbi:hypothetical protein IG193_07190 [Infirmifilum lucidum]|uniref:Uncharacterized protein n=1 Tax=Infirmifilum lucidum TaxID=2776706 RepID=A0A7L9FHQ4_9CREN|nr:hypothetical protein [Infirmifilum lucidum]QOJ78533.1 hypothetical protein IG193_07190 [Infirmifilum lucidum]